MDFLVGYTGFVGSNLSAEHNFDGLFNSKNITSAFGKSPDLLVYAGVSAEMYLANMNPEADLKVIENAINNIKMISPKKVVLISTIGVYESPVAVDEDSIIDMECLLPYGRNRLILEQWVENNISEYLIVRLPGLYGKNLKKNFLYDYINIIPSILNEEKYKSLGDMSELIQKSYSRQDNGYYKCIDFTSVTEKAGLKQEFRKLGFTALNFTDSRGIFQYYNLCNLWNHISLALKHDIKKLNLAVEPISINELNRYLIGENFENILDKPVPNFDFYTKHADILGSKGNYISTKEEVLKGIKKFVDSQLKKEV